MPNQSIGHFLYREEVKRIKPMRSALYSILPLDDFSRLLHDSMASTILRISFMNNTEIALSQNDKSVS
jgi:hypothetical protein